MKNERGQGRRAATRSQRELFTAQLAACPQRGALSQSRAVRSLDAPSQPREATRVPSRGEPSRYALSRPREAMTVAERAARSQVLSRTAQPTSTCSGCGGQAGLFLIKVKNGRGHGKRAATRSQREPVMAQYAGRPQEGCSFAVKRCALERGAVAVKRRALRRGYSGALRSGALKGGAITAKRGYDGRRGRSARSQVLSRTAQPTPTCSDCGGQAGLFLIKLTNGRGQERRAETRSQRGAITDAGAVQS